MKKVLLALTMAAVASVGMAQNVTTNSAVGQSISDFLNSNLTGGGVYIYNAYFNNEAGAISADYAQIGTFQTNGYSSMSIGGGILLTTGILSIAEGPNDMGNNSWPVGTHFVDVSMQNLITEDVMGCATIDFDFVCSADALSFNYCFGSEEYPEFVASPFNDVFAFLLTGPDPETGEIVTRNIAMIPNTNSDSLPMGIPVAINTVNNGMPGEYGHVDQCSGCHFEFSNFYINNDYLGSAVNGVEYDGFTSKLRAAASVVPCTPYHMHISVCNVGDHAYDSGVFIEGNSFYSPSAEFGLSHTGTDTIFRDTPYSIPLSLAGTEYENVTVTLQFDGEATSGLDFMCTMGSNVINNGESITLTQNTQYLTITTVAGARFEQPKSLDLIFSTSPCPEYPNFHVNDTMHFVMVDETRNGSTMVNTVADEHASVYPNPASESLNVSAASRILRVETYDQGGRLVSTTYGNNMKTVLDTKAMPDGVYTLRIVTENGTAVKRAIIRHE